MKPNMPFFDLVARVPLRDLVPEEMLGGALARTSAEAREGNESWGSGDKGWSSGVTVAGTERRLVAGVEEDGKMSLRVAVLARDGRGGGEVIWEDLERDGANGSWSTREGGGVEEERECLRARGGGFWSELRTLCGGGEDESMGVFDLNEGGGGGACLVGWNVGGSW